MNKKFTLVINRVDPITDEHSTLLEANSNNTWDLKVEAERFICAKCVIRSKPIHWVFIDTIIALEPQLKKGRANTIIVGSVIEEGHHMQITIIG